MKDWRDRTTTFEDYLHFFESRIASGLRSVCLREVSLTSNEVERLLGIRREGVEIHQAEYRRG
jgi:hypothetical protein